MTTKHEDLVSVIVPVYNAEATLKDCLESILSQSHKAIEVMCVDDGSRDGSYKILQAMREKDPRITILKLEKNSGVASARNAGIRAARGRYISFCDADDLWMKQKLSIQLSKMLNSKAFVAHSSVIYRKGDKEKVQSMPLAVRFCDMKVRNYIPNSSGIYDAKRLGKFFQKDIFHEDYIMWSEILKQAGCSVGCDEPLAVIIRTPSSLTGNKLKSILKHLQAQRIIFKFGLFQIAYYFAINVFKRLKSNTRNNF